MNHIFRDQIITPRFRRLPGWRKSNLVAFLRKPRSRRRVNYAANSAARRQIFIRRIHNRVGRKPAAVTAHPKRHFRIDFAADPEFRLLLARMARSGDIPRFEIAERRFPLANGNREIRGDVAEEGIAIVEIDDDYDFGNVLKIHGIGEESTDGAKN
jgi:hypothetical protein